MPERVASAGLIAFAALLGLLEGPAEIAAVLALIGLATSGALRGLRSGLAERGILIWAAAGAVGMVLAVARGTTLSSEDSFRPLLALAFLIGSRGGARADDRRLSTLAVAFLAACALSSAYGLVQVAVGDLPLDRFFLKNLRSPQIWVPGKLYVVRAASGLFYNRLKLAHVGIVGLGLFGLLALRQPPVAALRRGLLAIGALVVLAAIVLTHARMAVVAFTGAAIIVALLLRRRGVAVLGTIVAAGLATIAAVGSEGAERLATLERDISIRRHLFATAAGVFRDHPLIGVGHGMYRKIAAPVFDGQGVLLDAHNLALHVLVETGLVGFLALAAAIGGCLLRVAQAVARDRALGTAAAVRNRFALFGLLAILILGLTHVPTHHAPVALLFWTLAGIAWSSGDSDGGAKGSARSLSTRLEPTS